MYDSCAEARFSHKNGWRIFEFKEIYQYRKILKIIYANTSKAHPILRDDEDQSCATVFFRDCVTR